MRTRLAVVAVLALFLSACGIPVPPDKANYVGEWKAVGMSLVITAGGRVEYERSSGGFSKSVSGPIQEFNGDDFVVGIWFLTTTFDVTAPPYRQDGFWKMVIDGVELTRTWPR